ncbi:hypothetical protein [Nostoc sp. CMAA1605]|nr:hypothetical protein [Nostoc sp. CMAA1605]
MGIGDWGLGTGKGDKGDKGVFISVLALTQHSALSTQHSSARYLAS